MKRRFRYFGPDTKLSPLGNAIMEENVSYLDETLGSDWNLNEPIQFTKHCSALAVQLALVENKSQVIDYLLSQNVNLNVPNAPAFVSAVSSLDETLLDKLITAGADIRAKNNAGYDAFDQAVAWEHFDLIPYLVKIGFDMQGHEATALNSAVLNGNIDFVKYAFDNGANINLKFGISSATLLHTATLKQNLEMIKLLISFGANPTIEDMHGQRPYHIALGFNSASEITQLIRSIEPVELHDRDIKLQLAKSYKVPQGLINHISSGALSLKSPKVEKPILNMLALEDLYEFRRGTKTHFWQPSTFLALSRNENEDYNVGEIVWCKKKRKVCAVDLEHDEVLVLGGWNDFLKDPAFLIEKTWNS